MDNKNWKDKLTPEQYDVLRNKSTEAPFSGSLLQNKDSGGYSCAGCGNRVFESDAKYNSGCGWPSFDRVSNDAAVELVKDSSFGMHRTEVLCKECGGHLGHVFDDGPKETTGKRFCINSVALDFKKD